MMGIGRARKDNKNQGGTSSKRMICAKFNSFKMPEPLYSPPRDSAHETRLIRVGPNDLGSTDWAQPTGLNRLGSIGWAQTSGPGD